MSEELYESWGRWPRPGHQRVHVLERATLDFQPERPWLPRGRGRSYGDTCLNADGTLLDTRRLDHFRSFDEAAGLLTVESGMTLASILDAFAPRGWFLPVVPGTELISAGGAVANDIHGKNHHRTGSFGDHVEAFTLARSDGRTLACRRDQEPELFRATIGGLGLTGLILDVTIRMRRIPSAWMEVETIPFATLEDFIALSAASERDWEYTVAWADWRARRDARGRGLFLRANHAPSPPHGRPAMPPRRRALGVPGRMPGLFLNDASLRIFNSWQAHRTAGRTRRELQDYRSYFFPLDGVDHWNRLYGAAGFLQYQCVLPGEDPQDAFRAIFHEVIGSTTGSYLTVLKTFGSAAPAGLLSFPRRGITIALDFPMNGAPVLDLCERLDAITRAAGGAVYPAKDARMSAASFAAFFPQARDFEPHIDPACSSSFWRRVHERS